jgi:predicted phosphodiesterase
MPKAAVLSDIHGNLYILEKALEIARNRGVSKYIILGDMITDGPDPDSVLDIVRSLPGYVIKGNREEYVLDYDKGRLHSWDGNHQCETLLWTYRHISRENMRYIDELPALMRINLFGIPTVLLHGSHNRTGELIVPSENIDIYMDMYDAYDEKLFLLGHSHQSYYIKLRDKIFINPGPLGIPYSLKYYERKDAFSFGIIDVDENAGSFAYEEIYIPYDPDDLRKYYLKHASELENTFWLELITESFYTKFYQSLEFLHEAEACAINEGYVNISPLPNEIWDKSVIKWRKEHMMKEI